MRVPRPGGHADPARSQLRHNLTHPAKPNPPPAFAVTPRRPLRPAAIRTLLLSLRLCSWLLASSRYICRYRRLTRQCPVASSGSRVSHRGPGTFSRAGNSGTIFHRLRIVAAFCSSTACLKNSHNHFTASFNSSSIHFHLHSPKTSLRLATKVSLGRRLRGASAKAVQDCAAAAHPFRSLGAS